MSMRNKYKKLEILYNFSLTREKVVNMLPQFSLIPPLGGPAVMSNTNLARSIAEAGRLSSSVRGRHASNFSGEGRSISALADPGEQDSEAEDGGLELWRLLPQLKDIPETLLKKMPLSAMFMLNNALAKEKKTTERLGVNTKLAQNAKNLARNPDQVNKGADNRRDILHPARFLGGASCALTELWAAARRSIGEGGVLPIGNYDLDAVGCGGCVSPKAWMELHNPASQELKLKMFHMPNVASSGLSTKKDGGEDGGDSLREIADLDSYRIALNTAREAMASAMPWNRSICALVGLMLNTNYMAEDLGGNTKKAAILTEFTDYVFSRNGLSWENCQPFLTTDELAHVWANWKCKRGITAKTSEKKADGKGNEKKKMLAEVCRMYNLKSCKNQAEKTCTTPWGKTLKHVCSKYMPGGRLCLKEHPREDHK